MIRSRTLALAGACGALAILALVAAIWHDGSTSGANNPPTSVLGTAMVDPTEPPPDAIRGSFDQTPVYASIEANGRFYIGGIFEEVGGEAQSSIAAIEVATGQLDPNFRPVVAGPDAYVKAMAMSPDGQWLYIGGEFTSVNGVARNRVAKIDARTGAVDSNFDPDINNSVETLAANQFSVWIGGKFGRVGGELHRGLAKVRATDGQIADDWISETDGNVLDIELAGADLWVGGNFDTISGQPIEKLARLNATTGAVHGSWNPDFPEDEKVLALSPAPNGFRIYVATAGTASTNGNAVRAYQANGTVLWQRVGAGDVQAIEATANTVYGGSHGQWLFHEPRLNLDGSVNPNFPQNGLGENPNNANAIRREKLFALSSSDGAILPWNPSADSTDGVWELSSGPSGLMVGGDFRNIFNPTGIAGEQSGVFVPHFAVFAGVGNGGNPAPEPLFVVDCAGTTCNFDASASLDNGSISSYSWDFGNGATAGGQTTSRFLQNNRTHDVTLTVTDNAGQTASRTQKVVVGNGGLPITPIGTTTTSLSNNTFTATIPANAQAGDVALAFVTVSNPNTTVTTVPTGWTALRNVTDNNVRTFIFWRSLTAAEVGAPATFRLSSSVKADLTVSTFRGVAGATPIAKIENRVAANTQVEHLAPALSFTGNAAVIHFWSERTSNGTEFFASPELATLSTSIGSGQSHINTTLAIDPTSRTAASPRRVAIAEHHGGGAIGFSIALRPGPPVIVQDATPPVIDFTSSTTQQLGSVDLTGGVTDDISGVNRVRVLVRNQQTGNYWNGTSWQPAWRWNLATLNGNDTWTLPNVNLNLSGTYLVQLWAWDNDENVATNVTNVQPVITVQ